MIITILINALGLIAAYYLARRLFSNGQFVDLVLSLAVVFYAQLIIVQIFWGILGRLSVGSLILSSGVIFGVVLLLFKPKISATASLIPSQQKSPGLNPGMNVLLPGEGAL